VTAIVSAEDRLKAENLQLRLETIQYKLQGFQAELQRVLETRNAVVTDMQALQQEFLQKYNIDLTKVAIMPDGSVKDLPQPVR
jgi:hypothetical protein